MTTLQSAGVAGMFYPDDPATLASGVDASLAKAAAPDIDAKAVIAPHAGHVYSGDIAGAAYALLARRKSQIKRVILLGPTHRMPVRGLALSPADAWATPLGDVRVDASARDALARESGVTVAAEPFAGEHCLEVQLPFIQRALGDVAVLPILVGDPAPGQVSAALDQLWGGPETAIIVSSDLSHFHDYDTARAKDEATAAGIERLSFDVLSGDRACGYLPVAGLMAQAQKRDLRVTALDVRNSGDTQGNPGRVVGYGSFAFEYAHAARIEDGCRRLLIDLTRQVLRQATLDGGKAPHLNINGALPRQLTAQRATFVTLEIGKTLRGCTGTIVPTRSLLVDVADNAWRSGFGDPRFPPLTAAELDALSIHVSILSTPRLIPVASEAELLAELRPDIDGLIIRDSGRQALFLPSVWEQVPDPRQFLQHLRLKAGMAADHWSPSFQAYRFVTESFGEDAPSLA